MGVIGGTIGYRLLKTIHHDRPAASETAAAYASRSKLEALFGEPFWREIQDKVVIDFGCGPGAQAIEMAERGARRVMGLDIQERYLIEGRDRARRAGVSDRCTFATTADEPADVIVSIDAFEHFADPGAILELMRGMIKPTGQVLASFGPTWYHPLGGHLFSVFPWAHLIFTERALIRWRAEFKADGATKFQEVAGGLNQMTIRRFERIVHHSPFAFARFEAVPIRRLHWLSNGVTREFTTSFVRCALVPRA